MEKSALSESKEKEIVLAVQEFAHSINSGSKVVADISVLIDVTADLPLSRLEYWERLIRNEFYSTSEQLQSTTWKWWAKSSPFLTWVDLCSWDGHKREKTLRTVMGGAPNRFFFALAVRRLNDWVPQVRFAAREKLPLIAALTEPSHVIDVLCVTLSHWLNWGRMEDADKQVLLDIISQPKIADAIKLKIITATSGPLTTVLAQICRTSALDKHLLEIATDAIQPSVRSKAYRSLLDGRISWLEGREWKWRNLAYLEGRSVAVTSERKLTIAYLLADILELASVDRSSIVKRIAAEVLIRELEFLGKEKSLKLAVLFASDLSLPVAERGNFALKRLDAI